MKTLPNINNFSSYSGCGNDFILIDDRASVFDSDGDAIRALCDRTCGIGADGIVLLSESDVANFRMTIFNADGSEAEMCGNGLRCLGMFILDLGYSKQTYTIETFDRVLSLDYPSDGKVRVEMGSPANVSWNLCVEDTTIHYLNTGVPHAVIFVDDVSTVPIDQIGSHFRHHSSFQPKGANVNFVELTEKNKIKIRTFERGVEGETLACGTGATASAIATMMIKKQSAPITVEVASKECLEIAFKVDGEEIYDVTMTGPVTKI